MELTQFDYSLDRERIAQQPAEPRDAARLLHTADMTDHLFSDLPELLRPDDLLVLNTTRVRRARLRGQRVDTGGAIEALLLERSSGGEWEALVRPARRIRIGVEFDVAGHRFTVIRGPEDGRVVLSSQSDVEAVAAAHGSTPLPPYIVADLPNPDDYQTVFAEIPGSAAAPTAGLHFSSALLEAIEAKGVEMARIDLHVGLGTFRPITAAHVENHLMHAEQYEIPTAAADAVNQARADGRRIVAVGTTVVRALESAASHGRVSPGQDTTSLFIRPGYGFEIVDALITNFHVPRSSLVVMVAAFMGDAWRNAYDAALERGYRFLSFGDAMMAVRL